MAIEYEARAVTLVHPVRLYFIQYLSSYHFFGFRQRSKASPKLNYCGVVMCRDSINYLELVEMVGE